MKIDQGIARTIPNHPGNFFYLSDDTFIEPDFVIYPRESGLENLSPETCLLAIEIADSSPSYDLGRKARLYAEFRIRELWVIDVNTMTITVHTRPQEIGYGEVVAHSTDAKLRPTAIADYSICFSEYKA